MYVSDASYISSGESRSVSEEYKKNQPVRQLWYLRSFPQDIKNCYSINVTKGDRYLIRATFGYGNYDGLENFPTFDLYLEDGWWSTIDDTSLYVEMVHLPLSDQLQVCLINLDNGTPFISALEFRPLQPYSYQTDTYQSLYTYYRLDMGSTKNKRSR